MTRQDRIAHMLSELGEGWEEFTGLWAQPGVFSGSMVVRWNGAEYYARLEDQTGGQILSEVGSTRFADSPRAAVDDFLSSARKRHEERAEILQAAEAARGWREAERPHPEDLLVRARARYAGGDEQGCDELLRQAAKALEGEAARGGNSR